MKTNHFISFTLWLALALVCLVISCDKNPTLSSITKKVINQSPQFVSLPSDTLPINLLFPTDLLSIDTFLLVMQHHEENIIQVYSSRSYKFLGSFLRKGNGPNEVLTFGLVNQWFTENGMPKILIQSYPNYLGVLDIHRSLDEKTAVFDRKYEFEGENARKEFIASHSVYLLTPTQLLMTKDPIRSGIKENNNFFFNFYDYEADKLFQPSLVYEDFPLMDSFLKASTRALKPDRTKMALFYEFFDMVSIVDLQTGNIRQIVSDLGKYNVSRVIDTDTRRIYYKGGKCSNEYLFGLYKNGIPVTDSESQETSQTSILRVFNWDGVLQYEADLGTKIRLISIDSQQQFLYGVTENDLIIRYDLSVLKGDKHNTSIS